MMKTYFVKVSWDDRWQPLCRTHRNARVDVDLNKGIAVQVEQQIFDPYTRVENFTVDFMLEVSNES